MLSNCVIYDVHFLTEQKLQNIMNNIMKNIPTKKFPLKKLFINTYAQEGSIQSPM